MQDLREMADRNRESAANAREELKRVRLQVDSVENAKLDFETKVQHTMF